MIVDWNQELIRRRYSLGFSVAASEVEVVKAFCICDKFLGMEWIDANFKGRYGSDPTACIVNIGNQLQSLEGLTKTENLVEKLKSFDRSAFSELEAIHMIRNTGDCELELEPEIQIGETVKRPDFRVRRAGEDWTIVEVTRPDDSELKILAEQTMSLLLTEIQKIEPAFEVEVIFLSDPTKYDISKVVKAIAETCRQKPQFTTPIFNKLAIITFRADPKDNVLRNLARHEDRLPRLGVMHLEQAGDKILRKIMLRIPVTDQRVEEFIRRKKKQLPKDYAGIIVMDIVNVTGGIKHWEYLAPRRFQPNLNRRVGAVCLVSGNMFDTATGPLICSETRWIENKFARIPVPKWIGEKVIQHGALHNELTKRAKERR